MDLIVNVEGKYDQDNREISWTFRSLDPGTGELPEDPMAGFLPPITESGYEIGWVDFTVNPKSDLPSGTRITNQAFVNFDGVGPWNPAPKEAPYLNTIDSEHPTSSVSALTENQWSPSFKVNWSGLDDEGGSGIKDYTIYVSDNEDSYTLWITTGDTSAVFAGQDGHSYRFYSITRDNVGNIESAPETPDAETTVTVTAIQEGIAVSPNPFVPTRGHTQISFFGAGLPYSKIKIYNKAAELVRSLEETEGKTQFDWDATSDDGKKLASGVYIWISTNQAGNHEKGKFAIIR